MSKTVEELELELQTLEEAAREVIWAANRNPEEGPTGWAQAMSQLSALVFDTDWEVDGE